MERRDRSFSANFEQAFGYLHNARFRLAHGGMRCVHPFQLSVGEVVADRIGKDEVTVRQALHQCAGPEPVRAVVGEVCFADGVKSGHRCHQVVIHPEAAHRVVNGRIDSHGSFIWVLTRYALVHVEKIAVALIDDLLAQAFDRLRKIQINAQAGSYTEAFVAYGFGIT